MALFATSNRICKLCLFAQPRYNQRRMDAQAQISGKTACIIGAGFGGLALAIRLQAAGLSTVLIEARDKVGGTAYVRSQDGFNFDCGPSILSRISGLGELWALTGHTLEDDLELLPIRPACRFHWADGSHFDLSGDDGAMHKEVARISAADLHGYDEYLRHAAALQQLGSLRFIGRAASLARMAGDAPQLLRRRAWKSAYDDTGRFVQSPRLRQVLTAHMLMQGANPMEAGSQAITMQLAMRSTGAWCARGGTGKLASAMARHFERLGGQLRLHDPVVHLHLLGNRIHEVETQSGWRQRFDVAITNADLVHTYRDLLHGNEYGRRNARKLARKRYSAGCFTVHFAIAGSWPGIPHNMVLFGPRFEGLLADIFDHGVLPQDQLIFLSHPSVTDPSLAPEGMSIFQAMIPVANMGKLSVDWTQIGPLLEQRVIREIGRRLVPDIADRIITCFHLTPRDHALDLGAHLGSAYGPAAQLGGARNRASHRDPKLANFYRVGANTAPGAGVPAVLEGAKFACGQILMDLET